MLVPREKYDDYYLDTLLDDWDPKWDYEVDPEYWTEEAAYPHLAFLPTKQNKASYYRGNYRSRWYNNYSRKMKGLDKIQVDKFVGKHVNFIVSKYIQRFRQTPRVGWNFNGNLVEDLLTLLGIEKAFYKYDHKTGKSEICIRDRWGSETPLSYYNSPRDSNIHRRWRSSHSNQTIFYIHPKTGVLMVTKPKYPKESDKAYKKRIQEEYEKLAAQRKINREKAIDEKEKLNHRLAVATMQFEINKAERLKRRREEQQRQEELTRQKMISKGFDPVTSFRKSINDG